MIKKHIYITGSHRSGSSWVGRMLSISGEFLMRDEEIFNVASEIGCQPFPWMYTYISQENEKQFYPYIQKCVDMKYDFFKSLSKIESLRDFGRVTKRKFRSLFRQFNSRFPQIFIEPIGLFSTEWFAKKFNTHVIVVIRHPASFVSSLKRLNWGFNFNHFLDQKNLMKRYLFRFEKEIQNHPQRPDIIGMGILQWKALYGTVEILTREHPEWIFVRHEDLASAPIEEFRKLYEKFNLSFTKKTEEIMNLYTSPLNVVEFHGKKDNSRRDSRKTVDIWKSRLTAAEIDRIRREVEPISRSFYNDHDWS